MSPIGFLDKGASYKVDTDAELMIAPKVKEPPPHRVHQVIGHVFRGRCSWLLQAEIRRDLRAHSISASYGRREDIWYI